jgi:hypothetical protein
MKCPFRCIVITKDEANNPELTTSSRYEEFAECYNELCPYYVPEINDGRSKQLPYCTKVEKRY